MSATTNTTNSDKTDAFSGFKIPKFDTDGVMDSYKKNLEILGLINKMSVEVFSGITKLQAAFVKQFMDDMGGVFEKGAKPSETLAKFSEVARDSILKAVSNGKQISDLITANNNELTTAITKRFKESIENAKKK
ncbi:MAG: TIGR01841 family phasin [Holosporaceae bacterium]|nr:TIGR01841 family phasin [Holosporaceae bacterium]